MVKEKIQHDYIVALPQIPLTNIRNVSVPDLVTSTSPRGAVSHFLARRVNQKLSNEYKSKSIGNAMITLRANFGEVRKYTTDLGTAALEEALAKHKGSLMTIEELSFKQITPRDLARNVSEKLGGNPYKYLSIARIYLSDNQ